MSVVVRLSETEWHSTGVSAKRDLAFRKVRKLPPGYTVTVEDQNPEQVGLDAGELPASLLTRDTLRAFARSVGLTTSESESWEAASEWIADEKPRSYRPRPQGAELIYTTEKPKSVNTVSSKRRKRSYHGSKPR